jgi:hypothetical protein
MEFRIADTFTESLARLTGDEQKAVETTAFDLQEVYDTELHLLSVACTRARDHLLVTGVSPVSEFLDDFTEGFSTPSVSRPSAGATAGLLSANSGPHLAVQFVCRGTANSVPPSGPGVGISCVYRASWARAVRSGAPETCSSPSNDRSSSRIRKIAAETDSAETQRTGSRLRFAGRIARSWQR